jgi:hypothetical protein
MARTRAFVLFVAVLLVLSGCKAFFDFNAFSSLDKAGVPNPSRYQGAGGLANLQSDLQSNAIVDALRGNYTTSQQILANLQTDYSVHPPGVLSSPDQKTAAILYANLALSSTYGDELANNIVDNIATNPPNGNIGTLIASVIPAAVLHDPTGFTHMVDGLVDANLVYQNLGSQLGAPPQAVPGMNMGDTAQKAAVAFLMNAIVNAVEASPPGYTQAAAVDQMYKLVNNDPSNTISGVTLTDPFTPTNTNLNNIFLAAGAPYPA